MQTILVGDDDKQIVEAIDIYLTGEGFQVIKAYDGYEALELLENNSVDLMIVDVMMPGLDGIRTTLKVSGATRSISCWGWKSALTITSPSHLTHWN